MLHRMRVHSPFCGVSFMKRGFCYLAMSFIAASVLLSGCSAGITAIQEVPAITVTAGTNFDTIELPAQVAVTLRDESSGKAAVEWEVSKWAGKALQESITVIGQVAGCKKQAMLQICVQPQPSVLWEWRSYVDAHAGTLFDEIELPAELDVSFVGHSGEKAPVVWDTAAWTGKYLEKTIKLCGRVANILEPAYLVVAVLPTLTTEELTSGNAAALMADRLDNDPAFYQCTWAPGRDGVTFMLGMDIRGDAAPLYVWKTDSPTAVRAKGKLQRIGFYHGLAWSYDGRYLAVHDNPSGETALYIVDGETLEVVQTMCTWSIGYWSPDSPEYLVASLEGGQAPTFPFAISPTTDLVLINAASGERKTLLAADSETLYSPQGWKGPGQALYTRNHKGEVTQDLVLSTRP